jgi:hypothetical protein
LKNTHEIVVIGKLFALDTDGYLVVYIVSQQGNNFYYTNAKIGTANNIKPTYSIQSKLE